MISFLAQDIISTQKMELLLAKFGEVSGEGVEHDDLNIEELVEELELEGVRYSLIQISINCPSWSMHNVCKY